jgi:hypothetical protein
MKIVNVSQQLGLLTPEWKKASRHKLGFPGDFKKFPSMTHWEVDAILSAGFSRKLSQPVFEVFNCSCVLLGFLSSTFAGSFPLYGLR